MDRAKPPRISPSVERKWAAPGPVQQTTNIGRSEQKREKGVSVGSFLKRMNDRNYLIFHVTYFFCLNGVLGIETATGLGNRNRM